MRGQVVRRERDVDPPGETGLGPLVSVVVPAYNAERFLRQSLDSILAQTYRHLEVVVVDDASTDGTSKIVHSYADPRIRYYRNRQNLGQFASLNAGLAEVRGDLVAIQHADDVYFPTVIERELEFLSARPELGAVFALDVFIDSDGREFGRVELPAEFRGDVVLRYPEVLDAILRYGNTFIRGGTSLVRREVYAQVGAFDSSYNLRGDLDMWLRIASAHAVGIIDEHLTSYRWGHDHLSTRYGQLRAAPEHFFVLMDRRLAGGDRPLATPEALAAYEAHRAEDLLMVAVNLYILDRRDESRAMLARTLPRRILASQRVQRGRLVALWALLHMLARLPRIPSVADRFYRHWHAYPTSASAGS